MARDAGRALTVCLLAAALVTGVLYGPTASGGVDPTQPAHSSGVDLRPADARRDAAGGGPPAELQTGDVSRNGSAADSTVRVGVIGSGFDTRSPALRSQVAGHRDFDASRGGMTHGTAVAEVVSDRLPESRLYLASIGNDPSTDSYAEAVDWLVRHDADVIVDAGSYFPRSTSAARRLAAATRHATKNGVVFVTSAGNYRERHWGGTGAPSGWVDFGDDVQANALAGGDRISGRVSLRLSWNSSADYDLYLYRHRAQGGGVVVAKSTARTNGTDGAIEAIDVSVPRGRYYAAVYAENGTDDPGRVDLFAAHHDLNYFTENGSVVSPVAMEGVIVVGAYDPTDGSAAPYSSRGGGETEVDLYAPELARTTASGPLRGTSAATPYVAGTAAVMKSHNESLSPATVERILERTADGNQLDAAAAVDAVGSSLSANATAT